MHAHEIHQNISVCPGQWAGGDFICFIHTHTHTHTYRGTYINTHIYNIYIYIYTHTYNVYNKKKNGIIQKSNYWLPAVYRIKSKVLSIVCTRSLFPGLCLLLPHHLLSVSPYSESLNLSDQDEFLLFPSLCIFAVSLFFCLFVCLFCFVFAGCNLPILNCLSPMCPSEIGFFRRKPFGSCSLS